MDLGGVSDLDFLQDTFMGTTAAAASASAPSAPPPPPMPMPMPHTQAAAPPQPHHQPRYHSGSGSGMDVSMTPSGLTPTGLTPTGVTPIGMTPTGLTPTGLTPTGMAYSVDPAAAAATAGLTVEDDADLFNFLLSQDLLLDDTATAGGAAGMTGAADPPAEASIPDPGVGMAPSYGAAHGGGGDTRAYTRGRPSAVVAAPAGAVAKTKVSHGPLNSPHSTHSLLFLASGCATYH